MQRDVAVDASAQSLMRCYCSTVLTIALSQSHDLYRDLESLRVNDGPHLQEDQSQSMREFLVSLLAEWMTSGSVISGTDERDWVDWQHWAACVWKSFSPTIRNVRLMRH